jgi:sulfide:quinone oxidoreductase
MTISSPLRVLIAGGGAAALEAVLALRALAGDRVRVELLSPSGDYVRRPASVVSPFSGTIAAALPFERLAELGVTRHAGSLAAVDPDAHEVVTSDGGRLPYDRLIVATGARAVDAIPGAVLFRGRISAGAVEGALRAVHGRAVFAVPTGNAWTLPVYELALLAARELPKGTELAVVTPESHPLERFGKTASGAVARRLERAGVEFFGSSEAQAVLDGALALQDGRLVSAGTVIALPRLEGPRIAGLPADAEGFIPIDEHAAVTGVADVYAAGDATAGPVKQGGLATQQADAAAAAIAAAAGADVQPSPYEPLLRAVLLTGDSPLYLRTELGGRRSELVSETPLWWPPEKIAGRHLAAFLAQDGHPGPPLAERVGA